VTSSQQINDWTALAIGLGPPAFTVLVVIVFGYVLRLIPKFPNPWIPICCVVMGTILFPILAHKHPDDTVSAYLIRTIFMGMIIGFGATSFHKTIISKFEDKVPGLKTLLENADDSKKP
jgi:ABC-type iron transport system FetAB permease component